MRRQQAAPGFPLLLILFHLSFPKHRCVTPGSWLGSRSTAAADTASCIAASRRYRDCTAGKAAGRPGSCSRNGRRGRRKQPPMMSRHAWHTRRTLAITSGLASLRMRSRIVAALTGLKLVVALKAVNSRQGQQAALRIVLQHVAWHRRCSAVACTADLRRICRMCSSQSSGRAGTAVASHGQADSHGSCSSMALQVGTWLDWLQHGVYKHVCIMCSESGQGGVRFQRSQSRLSGSISDTVHHVPTIRAPQLRNGVLPTPS